MNTIEIQARRIDGLSVRTCNADEADPRRARIGALWADFGRRLAPHIAPGAVRYAVYHRYASDANGAYDVLVGSDSIGPAALADTAPLQVAHIAAGTYAVFEAHGPMPQAMMAAWARIWAAFADPQCPYARSYTSDFECHAPDGAVTICIGVLVP